MAEFKSESAKATQTLPHKIIMENRENASISGVLDVVSFDENVITAQIEKGALIIKGAGLHIKNLNLDGGLLSIDGTINNVTYEDAGILGKKGALLTRIFK